jgi:hypothetical protein
VKADKVQLRDANFSPDLPTKFIIHGFIDTGFSSWVIKMSQMLSKDRDCNVFAVDWGGGSLPLYTQATANARLVGLEIAYMINYLKVRHYKLAMSNSNVLYFRLLNIFGLLVNHRSISELIQPRSI